MNVKRKGLFFVMLSVIILGLMSVSAAATTGYSVTFHISDADDVVQGADITILAITETTDSSGNAVFNLDGDYDYTISAPGRITKTGSITVNELGITENIILDIDPAGAAGTINNHVAGSLEAEVTAFRDSHSLWQIPLTSLTVNGGTLDNVDLPKLKTYLTDSRMKTADLSGTAFTGNAIPDSAFYGGAFESIVLPDAVTSIGGSAFSTCLNLTDITLPSSLESIGDRAFQNCSSLTSITIPDLIESLGYRAFYGSSLANLTLFATTPPSTDIQSFYNVPQGAIATVPAGSGLDYLSSDSNTTDRYWYGFLVIQSGGSPIPPRLMDGSADRSSVTDASFSFNADEVASVYYALVADGDPEPTIDTTGAGTPCISGNNTLNLTSLTAGPKDIYIVAKDSLGTLSDKLKIDIPIQPLDIIIANHVAGELENEIDAALDSLGASGLYSKIASLTVQGGILNSDDQDFIDNMDECLTFDFFETSFEENIIDDYVFSDLENLTTIILPDSVTTIGYEAFYECYDLTSIILPSDLTTIGAEAFYECESLATITLPDSVATIGDEAFEYCYDLTSVILPASLASIGEEAFYDCESLSSITLLSSTPPSVESDAFASCADEATAYVPYGSSAAYLAVDDGDTTDELWYELIVVDSPQDDSTPDNHNHSSASAVSATSVVITIHQETLDNAVAAEKSIEITTTLAEISFDAGAVATLAKAGEDVTITISMIDPSTLSDETQQLVGDHPVFKFSITSGDAVISQFNGNVTVSVPYAPTEDEDPNAIVIFYINAQGDPEIVSDCVYDPETGMVTFHTDHFSQYAVGYNKVTFTDIAANAWYAEAVDFIAARNITTGTSIGIYSPDMGLSRAQFLVMVMRAYGIAPDENAVTNFADAGNAYYTGYLAAAKGLGITNGIGNNFFAPNKDITRQEMFTLLYNSLKLFDELPTSTSGKTLADFSDASQIASWAIDAMTLFVSTGMINGNNGMLNPMDTTDRAEMAQVLYNLLIK